MTSSKVNAKNKEKLNLPKCTCLKGTDRRVEEEAREALPWSGVALEAT